MAVRKTKAQIENERLTGELATAKARITELNAAASLAKFVKIQENAEKAKTEQAKHLRETSLINHGLVPLELLEGITVQRTADGKTATVTVADERLIAALEKRIVTPAPVEFLTLGQGLGIGRLYDPFPVFGGIR